jgi:hypothetical protein
MVTNVSEQQAASIFVVEMSQIGKVAGFSEKWGGRLELPIRARYGKEETGPQQANGNHRPWKVLQL